MAYSKKNASKLPMHFPTRINYVNVSVIRVQCIIIYINNGSCSYFEKQMELGCMCI